MHKPLLDGASADWHYIRNKENGYENLKDKGQLVITLKEARYNPDLKDHLFSEEYLIANSQD